MTQIIILLIIIFFGSLIFIWHDFHSILKPQKSKKTIGLNTKLKIIKKYLTTADGIRISSWYIPVENPKAVIVLIHGYKKTNEDKSRLIPHAEYLNKEGYSTVLFDLRAFGESGGNKTFLGVKEWSETELIYDYMKSLPENKNKKIGFYGKSMGGVISIITKAITGKGDFIVAITPYDSFKSLFSFQLKQKKYPLFFLSLIRLATVFELGLNYERYSPINLIKKINIPIFILGAKYDDIVSENDAKHLFHKANKPKEFWEAPTNHYDIFRNNPAEFKKKTLKFLFRYV